LRRSLDGAVSLTTKLQQRHDAERGNKKPQAEILLGG